MSQYELTGKTAINICFADYLGIGIFRNQYNTYNILLIVIICYRSKTKIYGQYFKHPLSGLHSCGRHKSKSFQSNDLNINTSC